MQEPGNQYGAPGQSQPPQQAPFEPPSYSTPLNHFSPPGVPIPSPSGELPHWQTGSDIMASESGRGPLSVLPQELQGLNWGAFLMTWIWGIAHSSWWSLLCFVPYVGIIVPFIMLFKGNEWAWQNRRWESIQQFRDTQAVWTKWGIGLLILGLLFGLGLAFLLVTLGGRPARTY